MTESNVRQEIERLVKKLRTKTERVHDLSGVGYNDDADCHRAADLLEALALRTPSDGEVVAWRTLGPSEQDESGAFLPPKWLYTDTALRTSEPLYAHPQGMEVTDAARDVVAERQRQVEAEGWTPRHDDTHDRGEMAAAAGCYALGARLPTHEVDGPGSYVIPAHWPWDGEWWKPGARRRDLVKAGALILAEIERLDRLSALTSERNRP